MILVRGRRQGLAVPEFIPKMILVRGRRQGLAVPTAAVSHALSRDPVSAILTGAEELGLHVQTSLVCT